MPAVERRSIDMPPRFASFESVTAYPETASEAIARIRSLAERLGTRETRPAALTELRALADAAFARATEARAATATHTTTETPQDPRAGTEPRTHDTVRGALGAQRIDLLVGARHERLELLLLPSIFTPEDWGLTFLEGLLKVPVDEYDGGRLIEVGTGSGWICLALAKLTPLARVWGVDLNEHAAPLATCNAWLNGVPADGDRVRFGTSDLLRAVDDGAIGDGSTSRAWDFVIGCIPQVLRAETPEPASEEIDQKLYDLSNYCTIQHVYEDHFGLGLIARLLDEVPERLAPGGRVLLNLAGRPGRGIIERMFSRRSFATDVLFARRVAQASDTDIGPLVALEAETGRRFEFFLDAHSALPICAATAREWVDKGRTIWHEVAVWHARLRLPREVLALRLALGRLGMSHVLEWTDLGAASAERLSFATALASRLHERPRLAYAPLRGSHELRESVARYVARFFALCLEPDEIFVAPARQEAMYSLLLATCDPGDRVLVTDTVQTTFARALEKAGVSVCAGNDTLTELALLLEHIDVRAVVLAIAPSQRANLAGLASILDIAARRNVWVVIDESAHFNITSAVESSTLFELLAREPRRPNLIVLYGLIKNAAFPDFELTLCLPVAKGLAEALEVAGEVTYSRISALPQLFYRLLFDELLAFQVAWSEPMARAGSHAAGAAPPCSHRIAALCDAPGLRTAAFDPTDPELIRLDYGENESPLPRPLIEGLLAGCTATPGARVGGIEEPARLKRAPDVRADDSTAQSELLAEGIASFLLETRAVEYAPEHIVVAQGAWGLLHDLAHVLSRRLGRAAKLCVLAPCYGPLAPTLRAGGAEVVLVPSPTEARDVTADAWVICQPQNPRGIYHTRESLRELATHVLEQDGWLVSDEVFGLVNLTDPTADAVQSPVRLESLCHGIVARTLVLGGVSKEWAAGGLRVGWLATRDTALAEELRAAALGRIHACAAHAAAFLYRAFCRDATGRLRHADRHRALYAYLNEQRRDLAARHAVLTQAFPGSEEDAGATRGGLFLAPRVDHWLGARIDGVELSSDNLPDVLYTHTHVAVNGGPWCGDPQRIRAVFSVERAVLERAVGRLRAFGEQLDAEREKPARE
jgi:aspartate/methionine/tyrosine aminotransferase/methylase of polypeptide subunit release factors